MAKYAQIKEASTGTMFFDGDALASQRFGKVLGVGLKQGKLRVGESWVDLKIRCGGWRVRPANDQSQ